MSEPCWLEWGRRLAAVAQNGLTYCTNPFDLERYEQIREVAAEMLAAGCENGLEKIADLLNGESGYTTPKVDTRGVVFRDGKILLVKELSDGGWTLPGGWADAGEPPSKAVEREVFEEAGYLVKAVKLAAVFDRSLHGHPPHLYSIYKLFFLCDLLGGEAATSIETGGAEFFAQDAIPPLSISRTSMDEIQRMFVHYRERENATEFD